MSLLKLNRKMLDLEHNGGISEDEYSIYEKLLDAHITLSRFVEFLETASGDGAYEQEIQVALKQLEELE